MNPKCKCGGRFHSIDVIKPAYKKQLPHTSYTVYETVRINSGYATWKCDSCKKVQKQKLRVSKKGNTAQ